MLGGRRRAKPGWLEGKRGRGRDCDALAIAHSREGWAGGEPGVCSSVQSVSGR